MYDYRPPHQNNTAKKVLLCLFAAAAAAFVGSALVPAYPVILQAVGLCLFVPIIQISVRFLLTRYLYRLREREDGGTDFEIYTYRGGAKMQLVCRIGLEEITGAAPLGKENREPPRGVKRYHYCPDLAPKEGIVVSLTNGDGDFELLLSPDDYLERIFRGAAATLPPQDPGGAAEPGEAEGCKDAEEAGDAAQTKSEEQEN